MYVYACVSALSRDFNKHVENNPFPIAPQKFHAFSQKPRYGKYWVCRGKVAHTSPSQEISSPALFSCKGAVAIGQSLF